MHRADKLIFSWLHISFNNAPLKLILRQHAIRAMGKQRTSLWIDGSTARSLAPSLFQRAKRKKILVQKALQYNRWISHILPGQTPREIQEYSTKSAPWEWVNGVGIRENLEDSICWCSIVDGEYSTKSAYQIQLEGSFSKLRLTPTWRAGAEPKCKFFAWTLLHKKILTANNLIQRNWANDSICKLCGVEQEKHQLTYAKIVPSQSKFGHI